MPIFCDIIEEQDFLETYKVSWIISQLNYTPFSSLERESIRLEIERGVTSDRLDELYELVNRNLPEPIESGLNYNQTDILRKLRYIDNDERK